MEKSEKRKKKQREKMWKNEKCGRTGQKMKK